MQWSSTNFRKILAVSWLQLVTTVFSTTFDPVPFYQRNNDGSYRYGYSAGGGFSARQSASSANEVIGQYAQLQPDGRILNVRYKAGVGGFRPQYGAASSTYNGATFGASGSQGGRGLYSGGSLGSGPFGSRSLTRGSTFGSGAFNTPRSSIDGSLNDGFVGPYSPGYGSYASGPFGAGTGSFAGGSTLGSGAFNTPRSFIDGSLNGGSVGAYSPGYGSNTGGSFGSTPRVFADGGSTAGGFNGGASLGPGSPASRSPIGGSLGLSGRGQVPGSIGSRSPGGGASLGRPYLGTGLAGSSYGGFPYGSYGGDSNLQGRPSFALSPTPQPLFISTTRRPTFNTGPLGDGSYGFSNDNSARTESGDPSGTIRGPNTGFRPTGGSLADPNGLQRPITSTSTTGIPRNGGAYNFAYRTPDSTRQESADNRGNVQGSYSFRNENGDHDLSFVAGPTTGFQPTGGSLAVPNGVNRRRPFTTSGTNAPVSTRSATTMGPNGGPTDRSLRNDGTGGNDYTARTGLIDNDQRLLSSSSIRPSSPQNGNGGLGGQGSNGAGGVEQQLVGGDLSNPNRVSGGTVSRTGVEGSRGFDSAARSSNSFSDGPQNLQGTDGALSSSGDRGHGSSNGGSASKGLFGNISNGGGHGNGDAHGTGSGKSTTGSGGTIGGSNGGVGSGGQNYGTRSTNPNGVSIGDAHNNLPGASGTTSNTGQLQNRGSGEGYGVGSGAGLSGNGGALANTYGDSGSGVSINDGQRNLQGAGGAASDGGLSLNRGNGLSYRAGSGSGLSGNGGSVSNSYGTSGSGTNAKGGSDGSYNFSYNTGRQAHQERNDGRGRVDGSYSYLGDGGHRSLRYQVRPGTGFQVTGGNLASKTPK